MTLLQAENLAVGYWPRGSRGPKPTGRRVLSGMNLALEGGRFIALLGPNGRGKSNLLRTLVGMKSPLECRVLLGGSALAAMGVAVRSERVAAVLT